MRLKFMRFVRTPLITFFVGVPIAFGSQKIGQDPLGQKPKFSPPFKIIDPQISQECPNLTKPVFRDVGDNWLSQIGSNSLLIKNDPINQKKPDLKLEIPTDSFKPALDLFSQIEKFPQNQNLQNGQTLQTPDKNLNQTIQEKILKQNQQPNPPPLIDLYENFVKKPQKKDKPSRKDRNLEDQTSYFQKSKPLNHDSNRLSNPNSSRFHQGSQTQNQVFESVNGFSPSVTLLDRLKKRSPFSLLLNFEEYIEILQECNKIQTSNQFLSNITWGLFQELQSVKQEVWNLRSTIMQNQKGGTVNNHSSGLSEKPGNPGKRKASSDVNNLREEVGQDENSHLKQQKVNTSSNSREIIVIDSSPPNDELPLRKRSAEQLPKKVEQPLVVQNCSDREQEKGWNRLFDFED
jgi:hypothetical protein